MELQTTQLEVLSLSKLIKSDLQIRQLKNDVPLRQALAYCFVLVGLDKKNYPSDVEKTVLLDFVTGAYGGLVAEEIKIAFKMAVAHKFPDLDINCYQKFSAEYFGRVMAAYYIWRGNILKEQNSKQKTLPEVELNNLDYYERRLFQLYDHYCETNEYLIDDHNAPIIYDDLRNWNLINFSKEEREAFGAEARIRTPKKKRDKITEPEESKEDHDRRIIKAAKCISLKRWIEEQSFNETKLRDIITILIRK